MKSDEHRLPAVGFDWIIFDAVGTLMTPDPPVAAIYCETGRRFGATLDEEEVRRRFSAAFRESERCEDDGNRGTVSLSTSEDEERRRWRWIVGQVFDDMADPERCFEELFSHFAKPAAWRWYADVGPALRPLQQAGLRIGIGSNFDFRLHGLIDASPFRDVFAVRAISSLIGFRKPDPRFFQAVCDMAGAPPERILFLGDDPVNDIAGAAEAGMTAVRIDRRPGAIASPGVITDLQQCVEWLSPPRFGSLPATPVVFSDENSPS